MENIENQSFSHTRREQPTSPASTSRSNNTQETVHDMFTDDVSEDETEMTTSHDIIRKINFEIDRYKSVSMKKEQKANLSLFLGGRNEKQNIHIYLKLLSLCESG